MVPRSKEELRNMVSQTTIETYEELTPQLIQLIDQTKHDESLTEAQKQAVKNKLLTTTSYQTFDVYYHVDPTLIGGMVIRVGDRVVDSSIRTKLEDMKKQLLNIQLG